MADFKGPGQWRTQAVEAQRGVAIWPGDEPDGDAAVSTDMANPYHDDKGRFTFAPGGPAETAQGPQVDPDTVEAMENGSAEPHLVEGPDGKVRFTPERQALHDRIINEKLQGKRAAANPTYHIMGGGPASGKSRVLDSELGVSFRDSEDTLVVNPDDMKAALPEYQEMVAAGDTRAAAFTHEESSYLSGRLQNEAMNRGISVTMDATGDSKPSKARAKILTARARGYAVQGHYVTVPTEMAVDRAIDRAQRTGRWIPEAYMRNNHAQVSATAMETRRDFDTFDLFDTRTGVAVPVLSWDGQTETVHDEGLWGEFQAKANER